MKQSSLLPPAGETTMPRTTWWVAGTVQLALLSLLASCKDLPTESIKGPGKIVESLVGCRVEVATGHTKCEPISPEGKSLGQGALDLIEDAQWMVETQAGAYTPADSTYRFNLRVNNDTEATLGTTDGVTATGLKVFLPVRVMGYAGRQAGDTSDPYGMLVPPIKNTNNMVQARNPDGVASFTAKDQPYWNYPEILEPGESSGWREWQFTVDPSVSYFYFAVSIFTHAAGKPAVPSNVPDGWLIPVDSVNQLFAQQNLIIDHPRESGSYPRNLVMLGFRRTATADERQAAIDHVNGTLVGGNGAHYYVEVTSGVEPVWTAVDALVKLPQVEQALPFAIGLVPTYIRPNNGTGWARADWAVHVDSAWGANWAPEAIAAPGAWGCETGSSAVKVAVIDLETDHGESVGAILSNPGNTGSGTTGIMWNSSLVVYDASRGVKTPPPGTRTHNFYTDLGAAIETQQARVINISVGSGYTQSDGKTGRLPNVGVEKDIKHAQNDAERLRFAIKGYEAKTTNRPLYVIAAGNYQVDASYSGYPQLATDPDLGPRVIVVAAHDSVRVGSNRRLWANSTKNRLQPGSNTGTLPSIAAPGEDLHIHVPSGDYTVFATSFAAPHVAGIAGLLFSQVPDRDAEKVRSYILEGAARGRRKAGGYPIANAYESLKRGAEDRGAPLCGNRVWIDGAQIYARRGGGVVEALGPAETNGQPVDVLTQHGGRRILYNTTTGGRALERQDNGTWQKVNIPSDWLAQLGGTTWSVGARSHGNDTLVMTADQTSNVNDNMWWRSADQLTIPLWRMMGPFAYLHLGSMSITDIPEQEATKCVERIPNGSCTFYQVSGRYWLFRMSYPQAYGPVLITVSPVNTEFVEETPWVPCARDASLECRRSRSELRWYPTKVYSIPLTGGQAKLVGELPNTVFWIGQSEEAGSDTLVMGRGAWTIDSWFDGNTRAPEPTRSVLKSCAVEYRSLGALTTVNQTVANSMTCGFSSFTAPANSGGGSITPDRMPVTPNGGSLPSPRSWRIDIGDLLRAEATRRR